ncbi:MAG TPA: hypothetical protein VGR43_03060, partial [Dehalococcoidia bacterium]|nr:hypothetical protein [Dehalococcoidia bacterium]
DVESEYAERVYSSNRYQELTRRIRAARKDPPAISAKEREEHDRLVLPIPELNAAAGRRLQSVLGEYRQQRTGSGPQLEIDVWSVMQRSRLRPTVPGGGRIRSEWLAGLTVEERTRHLDAYRREMDEFAAFLKKRFLRD